jgi:hypothetical protein
MRHRWAHAPEYARTCARRPTVIVSDMTAYQIGLLRSHLGTKMPSGGGYIISTVLFCPINAHGTVAHVV